MEDVRLNNSGKKYVIAVSGGVDSMVLLDLATRQLAEGDFVVAHMRHNIRSAEESDLDLDAISMYCDAHSLKLELGEVTDGATSEDALRTQRYSFLESVRVRFGFDLVMTAHHHDDYVETAIFNLFRGTSGSGLVAMKRNRLVYRPLIDLTKSTIVEYAVQKDLRWNEDSTNTNTDYARNKIRSNVIPLLKKEGKYDEFKTYISAQEEIEQVADGLVQSVCESLTVSELPLTLTRFDFVQLPHTVSSRVLYTLLKAHSLKPDGGRQFIDKVVVFIKTAAPGTEFAISGSTILKITTKTVQFIHKD